MRHLLLAAVAALMLAGCSGSPAAGDTPLPRQPESSATTSNAIPTPQPSPAAAPADCVDGRYRLVRFVGVGDGGNLGTGEGGDVAITFEDGAYLLRGAGKDPIKLTLAGQRVDLLVDGSISGDYRAEGTEATFTLGEGTGSATLSVGWLKESVSMAQIGSVLASDGDAELSCANGTLIITLPDIRLELGRV
jgi:hypothetical protein